MHIHILGICGTFMGGIAELARAAGHRVTGCDANVYPPMSTQLENSGITLIEGFDAAQTRLKPDYFVIGNAISRGNPLLETILAEGLPYISGPQWLAEHVLQGRWVLGVAGTHGKTTTASLLAWILEHAGYAPGFLIGGVPINFGISARLWGNDQRLPYFVIEADEYDTAFCDKRSKFIHYRPRTLILNNLEFDHADIFTDLAAIETQFHHLVRTLPQNGSIVANAQENALSRVIARGCWTPISYFNTPDGWHIDGNDEDGSLSLKHGETLVSTGHWSLIGEHNRNNALAAILAAAHLGILPEASLSALAAFQNVKRRLECRGTVHGITVYDDFAHHPTAIATTLDGLAKKVGQSSSARIFAVLEPRSNTMKQGVMKAELPASLAIADHVFCYTANLGWDAHAALAPLGDRATLADTLDTLIAHITHKARAGDHILIMSNGGFGGIHEKLLGALSARFS